MRSIFFLHAKISVGPQSYCLSIANMGKRSCFTEILTKNSNGQEEQLPSITYFFSRVGWLWANDASVPRKVTSGLPGWIFLYSAQASFSWLRVDLARLLRRAYSRSVWIISFEFVKVCGIRFSIWDSFIGFHICCCPISTILSCLFSVGVRISWKKLC